MDNQEIQKLFKKNLDAFSEYIKGKKVAIIGPSPSVTETANGEWIESNFDVIIRINKQWTFDKSLVKYIGSRTDVLINCLDSSPECGGVIDTQFLAKNGCKFIIGTSKMACDPKHRDNMFHGNHVINNYNNFLKDNIADIPLVSISPEIYDKYDSKAQTRINTGLMGIFYILTFPIRQLYIKGFTFFLDGYLSDYRSTIDGNPCNERNSSKLVMEFMNKHHNHNQERQWKLFKSIYRKKQHKILLDDKLLQIVNLKQFPKL